MPFRPAHSISKLKIRRGAILDHSPSGACEIKASQLCRAVSVQFTIHTGSKLLTAWRFRSDITSAFYQPEEDGTSQQAPRSSSYRQPIMKLVTIRMDEHAGYLTFVSIINRSTNTILLSKVGTPALNIPSNENSPFSKSRKHHTTKQQQQCQHIPPATPK
jgi:hypothetical protein